MTVQFHLRERFVKLFCFQILDHATYGVKKVLIAYHKISENWLFISLHFLKE